MGTSIIRRGRVAVERTCVECGATFYTINQVTIRCQDCLKKRKAEFAAHKPGGLYPPRACLMCGQAYVSSSIRVLCCAMCEAHRAAEPEFEALFQKRAKARREAHAHHSAQLVFAYADLQQKQAGCCPICTQAPEHQMMLYPSDREPVALLCQPCATAAAALVYDAQRARRLLSLLLLGRVE